MPNSNYFQSPWGGPPGGQPPGYYSGGGWSGRPGAEFSAPPPAPPGMKPMGGPQVGTPGVSGQEEPSISGSDGGMTLTEAQRRQIEQLRAEQRMLDSMSPMERHRYEKIKRMKEYADRNPSFARRMQALQEQQFLAQMMGSMGFGGGGGWGAQTQGGYGAGTMRARSGR